MAMRGRRRRSEKQLGKIIIIMKSGITTAFFIALVSTLARGETFIGPTTATNRLLVSSNSAIIITATYGDFTNSMALAQYGGAAQPLVYYAPLQNGTEYALAGPAELVFSNAALFTFYRVTNAAIFTLGVANDPFSIAIASNQTLRFFGVPEPVNASFSRQGGGSVFCPLGPNQPAEFTGPGELEFNSGPPVPHVAFVSYFIAEDGFVVPDQRAIAGPTGSFAVTVEKSFDLNTWQPVLLENTSDANHAFYRLNIQR
jgi:hypothetical protein